MRCSEGVLPPYAVPLFTVVKRTRIPRKYNHSRERITSNQIYLGFTQSHFNIISITIM